MIFKDLTTSTEIRDIHVTTEPHWDEVTLSTIQPETKKVKSLNSP